MTKLTHAAVADVFATVTAEALDLPEGEVPAPQGDRRVALMNDWLATRNWRFAYVRDPQTFAWPGSWIALAVDERSPSGWRPVLMFGDPSGPLHDPLGGGRRTRDHARPAPVPLDRRGWRTDFSIADRAQTQVGQVVALLIAPHAAAGRAHMHLGRCASGRTRWRPLPGRDRNLLDQPSPCRTRHHLDRSRGARRTRSSRRIHLS